MSQNCYLIGVTGGSGSGKTHFLKKMMDALPTESISLFSMDNYYKPIEEQLKDSNGIENFDLPTSIDRERFHRDLISLVNGNDLILEEYNFNYLDRERRKIKIKTAPLIIVEGLFTMYFEEVRDLLNLKVYVETPDYLMLKRRIFRDAKERGYDLDDVLYRFEHHVTPAFKQFVLPSKESADLIIPNHRDFDIALGVIVNHIRQVTGI